MVDGANSTELEQRGFRSPYYREVTPDYIFGGVKPGFLEMSVVTTKASPFEKMVNHRDVIEHTEEITLKLAPMQAKSLITWLLQNIKLYESAFGKITNGESDPAKREINEKVDELLAAL